MFSHASCSCEVFQCATKGYFALLILFKEVPTPSILPTLVSNGKMMKMKDKGECHFYLLGRVKWRGWGPL